jgi:hypothetical protein
MLRNSLSRWPAAALLVAALVALVLLAGPAMAQEGAPQIAPPGDAAETASPPFIGNHAPAAATVTDCHYTYTDTISAPGEVDYFRIDFGAEWPIVITVKSNGSPVDAVLTLYDADATTFLADQDQFNGNDPRLHYVTRLNGGPVGSRHYVRVHDYNAAGGPAYTYEFSWRIIDYVGMTTSGTVGGVAYEPGDILARTSCRDEPKVWSMFIDGSDVGIDGNLRDFAVLNGNPNGPYRHGAVIMSFAAKEAIPNFGNIVPHDLALFQPNTIGANTTGGFYRFFDGSDVGLTKAGEKIDAVAVHFSDLLLSTVGNAAVTPPSLSVADEDLLLFDQSALGTTTAGTWSQYFDGSDEVPVGLDLTSFYYDHYSATGNDPRLWFVFDKPVTLAGVVRQPNTTSHCYADSLGVNTSCFWPAPTYDNFDFSDPGLSGKILDGYDRGTHFWPTGFHVSASGSPAPAR